jgi:hypothetical protein
MQPVRPDGFASKSAGAFEKFRQSINARCRIGIRDGCEKQSIRHEIASDNAAHDTRAKET